MLLCQMLKAERSASNDKSETIALMMKSGDQQYDEALRILLTGLPNAPTSPTLLQTPETFVQIGGFLERGGLSLSELDSLKVIHVSGTKGKGTTCAFVESILRHAGLKTGFSSSPHLITIRERIRIDGKSISRQKFTKYFFEVYNNLLKTRKSETDMPRFFGFITCMAYYVFYHENVDVAIMEVGAGGSYCPTNIVRNPIVIGITAIAMEHVEMLGNTIEEIARHKAGIIKENAVVYTVQNQAPEVLQILRQRASELKITWFNRLQIAKASDFNSVYIIPSQGKAPLFVVPPLVTYNVRLKLGIDDGVVSKINASLAIQLANAFLKELYPEKLLNGNIQPSTYEHSRVFPISDYHISGLENCAWTGRFQTLRTSSNLTYYLDGAHTLESLEAALNWFMRTTDNSSYRVLVFFITGGRNAETLIQPFVRARERIQIALFSPLVVSSSCCTMNPDNWCKLEADESDKRTCQNLSSIWTSSSSKSVAMNYMDHVVGYIHGIQENNINILITGSLRMVGTYLSLLKPDLEI